MFVTSFSIGHPRVAIITLDGMVDHGRAETLRLELASLLARDYPCIVLDCTKATVICSVVYGAICQVTASCRQAGGDLRLAGINAHMHRILEVLTIVDWVTLCQSVDAAVTSFRPSPDLEETL